MTTNIEKYRNPYETDKEWKLKKQFIEKYKNKYDENRLLCLAQCYANIETMGCRYTNELMKQIKDLTSEFPKPAPEELEQSTNSNKMKQNKQQLYNHIKFVPSSVNANENNNSLISKSQPISNKQEKQKPSQNCEANKSPSTKPQQIQILSRNTNNNNKPAANAASDTQKFQTIAQLNSSKQLKINSPPKTNNSTSFSSKPSPSTQTNIIKAWNSPNTSNNINNSNNNNNRNKLEFQNSNSNNGNKYPSVNKLHMSNSFNGYHSTNNSFSLTQTPSVPSSTMEQSPAPQLVPIPFGLSTPTFQDSSIISTNPLSDSLNKSKSLNPVSVTRNALLNSLFTTADPNNNNNNNSQSVQQQLDFSEPKSDLLSLLNEMNKDVSSTDTQFQKLNKISKLRALLREDNEIISFVEHRSSSNYPSLSSSSVTSNTHRDHAIIEHFKSLCQRNNIQLDYVQFVMPDKESYYGEIYLEGFRLIKEQDKKRKRCCYFAHRNALFLLYGQSELAVRVAPAVKRASSIALDVTEAAHADINFDYELYLVDSFDYEANSYSSLPHFVQTPLNTYEVVEEDEPQQQQLQQQTNKFEYSRHFSLPAQLNTAVDKDNMLHLNTMLKLLILPQAKQVVEDATHGQIEEDEDENDRTDNLDRKTRIKESMGAGFCLFIPADVYDAVSSSSGMHERNAIQILNNSCQKSGFLLEFELKQKSSSTKITTITGRIHSDSEEENENENVKRKFKCKCLINRIKICSSHAESQKDAKRQAAYKSLVYLAKIYPVVKEKSYQEVAAPALNTVAESTAQPPRYFKITKEELFKGLVPPTLFETSLAFNADQAPSASNLGLKLLTKMGWKGEGYGLGKSQQGITKPIEVDVRKLRSGIGSQQHVTYDFMEELKELDNKTDTTTAAPTQIPKPRPVNMQQLTKQTRRAFINNIQALLKNFIASITEEDLVFEKSLTSEERALVHKEAHRFGLKTNSQGSGDNRFLVVNKKRTSDELIEQIKKHGRFNKYEMVS